MQDSTPGIHRRSRISIRVGSSEGSRDENYDSPGNKIDYRKLWDDHIDQIKADYFRKNPHKVAPESDQYFQKHYFALDNMVENMEQKLDIVLRSHEMNFLESYRNHMRHIKRDLEKYKKALNEKDFENRKDDKV